jgi:hypothetical protein
MQGLLKGTGMKFFFLALLFMFIGRKAGWALSKNILYSASFIVAIALCLIWGCGIALLMQYLINWHQPSLFLKIIMGYALGGYIAIPNFGLILESSIPASEKPRHSLVSVVPLISYIVLMVILGFVIRLQ